jgi:hypothetical protein
MEGLLIELSIFINICLSSLYNRAGAFVPIKIDFFDILWSTRTRMKFGSDTNVREILKSNVLKFSSVRPSTAVLQPFSIVLAVTTKGGMLGN